MSASITGRGVVVRKPGGPARVEEIVIDPPGPGEVRVKIIASGVCHTDLHTKLGNFGGDFPYLLGHEATAVVESVGEGVTRPAVGDVVTLSWRAPCGVCRFCVRGDAQLCAKPTVAKPRMKTADGAVLGRVLALGTFATHTVVAAGQAIPMNAKLDPAATCLIGCAVATGVGAAIYAAQVRAGSTVAVFGCGAVGISVIAGARLAHAARVIAVDIAPKKLEMARTFGATDAVDARAGDPAAKIRELTGGIGVDYAFEAVGLPKTAEQAIASVDAAGTTILIGVPAPKQEITINLTRFFFTRGRLRATSYGDVLPARDFPLLASMYERGELHLDDLVSRRIGLDEVEEAFGAMERGETLRSVIILK